MRKQRCLPHPRPLRAHHALQMLHRHAPRFYSTSRSAPASAQDARCHTERRREPGQRAADCYGYNVRVKGAKKRAGSLIQLRSFKQSILNFWLVTQHPKSFMCCNKRIKFALMPSIHFDRGVSKSVLHRHQKFHRCFKLPQIAGSMCCDQNVVGKSGMPPGRSLA